MTPSPMGKPRNHAYEQWRTAHKRRESIRRYALNAAPFVALTAVVWWLL